MGLRHLIVVDRDNRVVGIVTRQDITEHRLHEKWHHEGSEMQKHLTIEVLQPSFVNVNADLEDENGVPYEYFGDDESVFADSSIAGSEVGDGEPRPPRGTCVCVLTVFDAPQNAVLLMILCPAIQQKSSKAIQTTLPACLFARPLPSQEARRARTPSEVHQQNEKGSPKDMENVMVVCEYVV
jgi:hypothetical protein